MKKRFVLLLALLLCLAGCSAEPVPETTVTEETMPQGYYVPESALEKQTKGAVRVYELPKSGYTGLSSMGDQLLLIASDKQTELTVLTGADCVPTATETLSVAGQPLYSGYGYFDSGTKQVVFLDAQLHETQRVQLPENMQGDPMIAPDAETVFYCVGGEIYGMQVAQKISFLIKSHSYLEQTLIGCYLEGDVIACQTEPGKILYVSTQTGQTLYEKNDITALYTYEDSYVVLRKDASVQQVIFGTQTGAPQQLNTEDTAFVGALQLGGILGWQVAENEDLTLQFYNVTTGKKTAAVTIPKIAEPLTVYPDRWGNCVWVLCQDGKTLLRWDIKASPVVEETIYGGALVTAENPDTVALDACRQRAKQFEKSYGIILQIWEDGVKAAGDYTLEAEYQPEVFQKQMDILEQTFQEFPKNFLKKCAKGKIRVCLVRSVDAEQKAVHYWHNKKAYIVLTDTQDLRGAFMRCLAYFVDSHVLGNSANYDYWYKQNPEDFVYGAQEQKAEYLAPETRYFTSRSAMQSSTEDRSELFYHAMQPDNEEMFQSPYMQGKLTALCKAIRDAWSMKRETEVFPWEQYLKEPVAYKK